MSHPYDEECCCVECCHVREKTKVAMTLDEHLKSSEPGSPLARLEYLLGELGKLFPNAHSPASSSPPEPKYLNAIRILIAKIARLKRGEFICQKCGLRKDDVHPTQSSF